MLRRGNPLQVRNEGLDLNWFFESCVIRYTVIVGVHSRKVGSCTYGTPNLTRPLCLDITSVLKSLTNPYTQLESTNRGVQTRVRSTLWSVLALLVALR